MTFTDEDLKRLKDCNCADADSHEVGVGEFRALIARLEAAEKTVEAIAKWEHYSCIRSDLDRNLGAKAHGEYVRSSREWRKAAGK